jgi:hypothetical protein
MARSVTGNRGIARVVGVLAVFGHLAAAFFYIGLPVLTVPFPAGYAFAGAWVVILAVSIWWLREHPWRSVVLVGAGFVGVISALWAGGEFLGWTA